MAIGRMPPTWEDWSTRQQGLPSLISADIGLWMLIGVSLIICSFVIYIYIYIYICHRHGKGIRKRDDEVWTHCNIWDFWHGHWQMHRWMVAVLLYMCSGFRAKRLEQTIMTSLYDITRISHATVGGNYKKESMTEPQGAVATVIWVFQHKHLGL